MKVRVVNRVLLMAIALSIGTHAHAMKFGSFVANLNKMLTPKVMLLGMSGGFAAGLLMPKDSTFLKTMLPHWSKTDDQLLRKEALFYKQASALAGQVHLDVNAFLLPEGTHYADRGLRVQNIEMNIRAAERLQKSNEAYLNFLKEAFKDEGNGELILGTVVPDWYQESFDDGKHLYMPVAISVATKTRIDEMRKQMAEEYD